MDPFLVFGLMNLKVTEVFAGGDHSVAFAKQRDSNQNFQVFSTDSTVRTLNDKDKTLVYVWGSNANCQLALPEAVKVVDSPQICEQMFDKTVVKAFCGDTFTAITTSDHLVHTFGLSPGQHQITSTSLVRLSTDSRALMFVYARSLNILRDKQDKQKVSLATEAEDFKIKSIYPVSTTKVLVVIEPKRDQLLVAKASPNDDTVSSRSMLSNFQKHEQVNVADRFFKQVMKIGKIGAISFQNFDLKEDSESDTAEEKKGQPGSDEEEVMSVRSFNVTNYSTVSESKVGPFFS